MFPPQWFQDIYLVSCFVSWILGCTLLEQHTNYLQRKLWLWKAPLVVYSSETISSCLLISRKIYSQNLISPGLLPLLTICWWGESWLKNVLRLVSHLEKFLWQFLFSWKSTAQVLVLFYYQLSCAWFGPIHCGCNWLAWIQRKLSIVWKELEQSLKGYFSSADVRPEGTSMLPNCYQHLTENCWVAI